VFGTEKKGAYRASKELPFLRVTRICRCAGLGQESLLGGWGPRVEAITRKWVTSAKLGEAACKYTAHAKKRLSPQEEGDFKKEQGLGGFMPS